MSTTESNPRAFLVPRENIHPRTKQPRHDITDEKIAKRRAEMKAEGQKQALLVEPHPKRAGHFLINEGELRWRATYSGPDWMGLTVLRVEVEEPRNDEAETFIQSALANDSNIPLSDYDWCMSVGYLYDECAVPLATINARFGRGRNWAEDYWAIYNGAGKAKNKGTETVKMPKDLADTLLDALKLPENKNKVKAIVGAPNTRLQRTLVNKFDSLTVDSVRAEIAEWERTHKPKAPAAAASSNGSGGGTSWFSGSGGTSAPAKPCTQSRGRALTTNKPDARKECADALTVMEGRVLHLQAWWDALSATARRELKVRMKDIAGALEDLPNE